jgi:hypothetical protein
MRLMIILQHVVVVLQANRSEPETANSAPLRGAAFLGARIVSSRHRVKQSRSNGSLDDLAGVLAVQDVVLGEQPGFGPPACAARPLLGD